MMRRLRVLIVALAGMLFAAHAESAGAQTLTVADTFVDTLLTASKLNAGGSIIVRRMTVQISGCRSRDFSRCFLFLSAQAGGGASSVSLLRWGTTDGGCVNPVENSNVPTTTPTSAAVLQVAAGGGSGSTGTGTVVLCYAVGWLTAPARFNPTLYFRLFAS